MLDLSPFPKIGNLTKGSGVNAIFDGSLGTTGYAEFSGGFVGVDFSSSPKRVDKVELVSATNGFDASGLTTAITLSLRGKKGPPPVNASDGTVLATSSFTDVNAQQTRTLTSLDKITAWDYVWTVISTGLWSVAAEMRVFEADEVAAPMIELVGPSEDVTFFSACNRVYPLPQAGVEVTDFRVTFETAEARNVDVDFGLDATHMGPPATYNIAVGVGMQAVYRCAPTMEALQSAPWKQVFNARGGFNISERNPQHYGASSKPGVQAVAAGFHQFSIIASAHTDGSSLDGIAGLLAEGGQGMGGLRIRVNRVGHRLIIV